MSLDLLFQNSPWMTGLTSEQLIRVRKDTQTKTVPADGFVCKRGELAECWIGVISGLVKINNVTANGKSTTLIGLAPGAWFGEGSILKDEPRRYDAMALYETELAILPKATFLYLLDNSISLGQFIGAIENERLLDVDTRVARALATMFNAWYPKQTMMLKISQEEVGQLAGLSRQRVNSSLKALEDQGLIKVNYGEIHILDLEGLSTFQAIGTGN